MIGWVAYMGITLFFFSIGILNSPIFLWGEFPRISLYNQYKRDEIYRISVFGQALNHTMAVTGGWQG